MLFTAHNEAADCCILQWVITVGDLFINNIIQVQKYSRIRCITLENIRSILILGNYINLSFDLLKGFVVGKQSTSVLIVSSNSAHIKDSLNTSPSLKLAGIDCYFVSEVSDAYYALFGKNDSRYRLAIVDSRFAENRGHQLLSCICKQRQVDRLLFVTDQHLKMDKQRHEIAESLSFTQFGSPDLDQIILDKIAETREMHGPGPRREVTRPSQLQNNIDQLQSRYEIMLEAAGEGIVGLDDLHRITFANPKSGELFGVHHSQLVGRPFKEFSKDPILKNVDTTEPQSDISDSVSRLGRGVITRPDGSFLYTEYTQSFVGRKGEPTVSVMVIEDISQRIRFEKKLRKLAHTDGLTELYNRYYFERVLSRELESRRSDRTASLVALLDLDGFKYINDNFGHGTGDLILTEVSERLKKCARRGDLIARLGGDEFGILMTSCEKKYGERVARKIVEFIQLPYQLGGNIHRLTCSVGITQINKSDNAKSVMGRADEAMYRVKNGTKNGFFFIESTTSTQNMGGEEKTNR